MTRTLVLALVAVALVCFSAPMALAAMNPDTGPGCGVGKLAWSDYKHQKNILPQSFMVTTNASFSSPIGITFGISGCTNDGKWMSEHKVTMFAEINFENLSQEMAQGKGEHLASLATLMGVPADQQPAFFALAQERYTTLIQSGETAPVAMIKALNVATAGHPALVQLSTNR
jgi:Protein of unknown function (DUF3015)